MLQVIRRCWGLALLLMLASCAQPSRQPESLPQREAPAIAIPKGAAVYEVDAAASEVHILVYRGGTLARLGHNHVISSKSLKGEGWLHSDFSRSAFRVAMPVQSLIIDDAQARAAHGAEFSASVPQKDIDGTRRNLMKPEVLDGERFPEVSIVSSSIDGTAQNPKLRARITIKDVTREVEVPVALEMKEGLIKASGELDLVQSEFGMKPFSVALGALEVQDRLHVTYKIIARLKG